MYKVLKAEMARAGVSREELAKKIGIKYLTLSMKINGSSDFKLQECNEIKAALGSELPIEKLFEKEA